MLYNRRVLRPGSIVLRLTRQPAALLRGLSFREEGLAASWHRSMAVARGSGGGELFVVLPSGLSENVLVQFNPGCPLGLIAF